MDHSQLVAELPEIERMSAIDRINLAKERRAQQLAVNNQYEIRTPVPRTRNQRLRFASGIALLEATSRGDIQEVERLLQAKSDPDSHNEDGLTPLHQAAIDNNEQLVRLLLHYNANVNVVDSEGWSPLHAAACCGYIDVVRLLIANGADLLAVNTEGNMPYDICDDEQTLDVIESEMAQRSITQELIDERRAEPENQMLSDMKNMHMHDPEKLKTRMPDGSTYLHIAAAHGFYDVVAFLLKIGFDWQPRDNDHWTPLHAAAQWNHPDIIELLCEYGADINVKTVTGETPFDLAEDNNTRAVIQSIMQQLEAKKKRYAFGVRDSRRQSRKRKKYESPQPLPLNQNGDNPFSARGAIRRQSLRDRSGLTPARLEAQQEQTNLIRSWSREDVANQQDDVSPYTGGTSNRTKDSPNKRSLKPGSSKTKPMSPDEWVKKLEAENSPDADDDLEGQLNRGGRGRSGSRKKKKKPAGADHELAEMRGPVSNGGAKGPNFNEPSREKPVCCCTIL
uniref:Uncharacterized protein n=1 Tax=Panagrolaimus sp. JU765 TaxID=591449 RepID=A0AC34RJ42_9BILA